LAQLILVVLLIVCGHEAQAAGLVTAFPGRRVVHPRPETRHGYAQGSRALWLEFVAHIRHG